MQIVQKFLPTDSHARLSFPEPSVDSRLADFFGLRVTSSTATMFATVLTDFRRPDLFDSATGPVCRNAATHLLMALFVFS
jgi:hypothetical protein